MAKNYCEHIMWSARRALGGQTPIALRQYSFSFEDATRSIVFKAEVERELTEDERENLEVAVTEVYADFYEDMQIDTVVAIVPLGHPLHLLPDGIVFSRERGDAP